MEIIGKPKTLLQAENDIKKLAECYDMISYGYYFHDLIDPGLSSTSKPSLRNLFILIGDYFLVKSSYDVASFKQVELYKIYVQSIQKYSEGEALGLSSTPSTSSNSLVYKPQHSSLQLHQNHPIQSSLVSNDLSGKFLQLFINNSKYLIIFSLCRTKRNS